MPETDLDGEVVPHAHGVLDVPGAHQGAPTQLSRFGHDLKSAGVYGPLQERGQAGESGYAQLARSGIFIVLQTLKPDPRADLMNSLADLQVVRVGKQVSVIEHARVVAGPGSSDDAGSRGRVPTSDGDTTGATSGNEVKVGNIRLGEERGRGCRIVRE